MPLRAISILFFACLLASPTWAFSLDDIAVPAQTRLSWVGKNIVQNGMPMQILQLDSSLTIAELQSFYHSEWRELHALGNRSAMNKEVGGWTITSTIIDDYNVVIQVKKKGPLVSGFISATPLDTAPEPNAVTRNFPMQWGTKVISSTESNDGGVNATTLILSNDLSVESNQIFYRNALTRNGWSETHSSRRGTITVLFFDRPSGSMEIGLQNDSNETMIFANVRGKDV